MMAAVWDLIIAGAGPAGLSAAQYGARAALKTLALDCLAVPSQALQIAALENYPGLQPAIDGYAFTQIMRKQAEDFGAKIISMELVKVQLAEDDAPAGARFALHTADGEVLYTKTLIAATGAKHRELGIPGEKKFCGMGVSYCASCDGPFFRGKKIFVIGGGDAAFDEARYLSRISPAKDGKAQVVLVHRRAQVRAQKALAERVAADANIELRLSTRPVSINGEEKVGSVTLEKLDAAGVVLQRYEEDAAAVFIFAGIEPCSELFAFAKKDDGGFIVTDGAMVTAAPGFFAAGDVRCGAFKQVATAVGDGAVAAHSAALFIEGLQK
jgi:thioredoxin reductase (NADPH)